MSYSHPLLVGGSEIAFDVCNLNGCREEKAANKTGTAYVGGFNSYVYLLRLDISVGICKG